MNHDMQKIFEAAIEKHGKCWIGWVDAVPGTNFSLNIIHLTFPGNDLVFLI